MQNARNHAIFIRADQKIHDSTLSVITEQSWKEIFQSTLF